MNKTFFERTLFLIGCSMILAFFSEFLFYNEGPVDEVLTKLSAPAMLISTYIELTLFYLLAIAPGVLLLNFVRASNLWSIFLAGGVIGLCIEGLIVPVIYFELPVSLIWTSLSWHPIIDVIFGLWVLQIWLRTKSFVFNAIVWAVIGILWGAWSTWPIGHVSDVNQEMMTFVPIADYAIFAFTTALYLMLGNALVCYKSSKEFVVTKIDYTFYAATSAVLFAMITTFAGILSIILPILVAICSIPLVVFAQKGGVSMISLFQNPAKKLNQLSVAAMPFAATLSYWLMSQNNATIELSFVTTSFLVVGIAFLIIAPFKLTKSEA